MGPIKISLIVIFSLCSVAFAEIVHMANLSQTSDVNSTSNETSDCSLTMVCKKLESGENTNRIRIEELEKSNQELNRRFELLRRELDEIKNGEGGGARNVEPLRENKDKEETEPQNQSPSEMEPVQEIIKIDRVEVPEIITLELNRRFESSEQKWDEQFTSLKEELEELKNATLLNETVTSPPQLYIDPRSVTSCSDAMKIWPAPLSAKQLIYPFRETGGNRNKSLNVLCDFDVDGGGWTIIQKRSSGPSTEFYKGWSDYTRGFGSLDGNFWLGLENIRALTKNGDQELRIELEDFGGEKRWAKYSSFSISDASDFYRLSIGGYYGTAGDSMISSYNINGMRFTTTDNDNDGGNKNCAELRKGAWWYRSVDWSCSHSNLNGLYRAPQESFPPGEGVVWETWRGAHTSLKKSQMKIRTKN